METHKISEDRYLIIDGYDVGKYDINLLEDTYNSQRGTGRVSFEAILQEAETPNQNKRKYSKNLLQEGLNDVKIQMQRNSFLGEMDHPSGAGISIQRQATVLFKEASHRIVSAEFDNNLLVGKLETLSEGNGKILAGLIRDNVKVGFSLRALGSLKEDGSGYKVVTKPFKMVTYDAVSVPSNTPAYITKINEGLSYDELLGENYDELKREYLHNKYIINIPFSF